MTDGPGAFDLLETIKWTPENGFFLLDRHLRRMGQSAEHFGYPSTAANLTAHLQRSLAGRTSAQRVRLLLGRDGNVRVECTPLTDSAGLSPARLTLAASPIDPRDPFLFHKTTNRAVYDAARRPGFDDVVLWNPGRQVTESTIANIVVRIGNRRVTPPVACGLLAGTFRAELLEKKEIHEQIVTLDELRSASEIWLVNSVREWWPAQMGT